MDINRMKYIITVARTGNISQAARELYLSQPALTKAIQKTEEELGVRLFERDSLPLRLTFAGERYVQQCKKILNIQRTLTREMQDIAQGEKRADRGGNPPGAGLFVASPHSSRLLPHSSGSGNHHQRRHQPIL